MKSLTRATAQPSAAFKDGCGVLRHAPTPGSYRHRRYAPSPALAEWIQHFWIESWNLPGAQTQVREVLPHPNVQLVFAQGRSKIYGVQLRRFVRRLTGTDRILGIKFRVGAFYPFLSKSLSTIADASISVETLFADASQTEAEILSRTSDSDMVRSASRFLSAHLPPIDSRAQIAEAAVQHIVDDSTITRVAHLVSRCGLAHRTLQRLFTRYVGASPQWTIKRYRIYGALEALGGGEHVEWASLANDLGYFDQAHFINDFKTLVGCTPAAYAQRLAV